MSVSKAFLIRFPSKAGVALGPIVPKLGIAGSKFEFEPLFSASGAERDSGLGLAKSEGVAEWFSATPHKDADIANQWDLAHKMLGELSKSTSLASVSMPDIVEPDLIQQWPYQQAATGSSLAASSCSFDDQNNNMPTRPGEFAWQLDDAFSQRRRARNQVAASGNIVRIVHLDNQSPRH